MKEHAHMDKLREKRIDLKQRFVNLDGNYNVEEIRDLQKDIEYYLTRYEDNANKDIENTLHLIKAYLNYALTDDLPSSYELVLPMLTNLEFGANTEKLQRKYNRTLLIGSIFVCKDYKQSFEILKAIEKSLEIYPIDTNLKEDFLMWAYANYAEMLLNTKYFVKLSESEQLEIEEEFYKYSEIVKELSKKNLWLSVTFLMMLRESYFKNGKVFEFSRNMVRRMLRTSEEKELELAIKQTNNEEHLVDLVSETTSFKKNIGEKIKAERLARNMSIAELADKANTSQGFLRLVENGAKGLTIEKLVRFANIFGLTVNDFIYTGSCAEACKASKIAYILSGYSDTELEFVEAQLESFKALKDIKLF